MIVCRKCGKEFEQAKKKRGSPQVFCTTTCRLAYYNNDWYKQYNRKKRYGVGQNDFEHMYTIQEGKCLVCTLHVAPEDMQVDHDHTSGVVRGLLCGGCNNRLGWYEKHRNRIEAHVMRGRGAV
jgi:hypothetical protein